MKLKQSISNFKIKSPSNVLIVGAADEEVLLCLHFSLVTVRADHVSLWAASSVSACPSLQSECDCSVYTSPSFFL